MKEIYQTRHNTTHIWNNSIFNTTPQPLKKAIIFKHFPLFLLLYFFKSLHHFLEPIWEHYFIVAPMIL